MNKRTNERANIKVCASFCPVARESEPTPDTWEGQDLFSFAFVKWRIGDAEDVLNVKVYIKFCLNFIWKFSNLLFVFSIFVTRRCHQLARGRRNENGCFFGGHLCSPRLISFLGVICVTVVAVEFIPRRDLGVCVCVVASFSPQQICCHCWWFWCGWC